MVEEPEAGEEEREGRHEEEHEEEANISVVPPYLVTVPDVGHLDPVLDLLS